MMAPRSQALLGNARPGSSASREAAGCKTHSSHGMRSGASRRCVPKRSLGTRVVQLVVLDSIERVSAMNDPSTARIDPAWAWQRYQPTAASPWDAKAAGHLWRRAAFGATNAELQATVEAGPDRAIDRLLAGRADAAHDALWATMSQAVRDGNNAAQLPALWLYRMLASPHPLREKMTLFWHNHFAQGMRAKESHLF